MNRRSKWVITAVIFLVAGALACIVALFVLKFDFKKLGTVSYVSKTFDIKESFSNIRIDGSTEDIQFYLSDDNMCKVVIYEAEKNPHEVRVEKDTLKISQKKKGWLWNFGIVTESPKITIYLPDMIYMELVIDSDTSDVEVPEVLSFDSVKLDLDTGDVKWYAYVSGELNIETSTGDISVSDISNTSLILKTDTGRIDLSNLKVTGDINTKVTTGKIFMTNVQCKNFISKGDTGKLEMTDVIASEKFDLERSTGDIIFNQCDAESIFVETDTGDVTGSFLSDKIFFTDTDTGDVDVPKSMTGGRCEITTDTGDILIHIGGEEE